jgi:amidohydrolase
MDAATLRLITDFRQESHRHPCLSDQEHGIADRVAAAAAEFNATSGNASKLLVIRNIGGAGVVLICAPAPPAGSDDPVAFAAEFLADRHVILFRAELDGLPIDEMNDPEAACVPASHRSVVPGVSMKCGHDGHHATMLGVMFTLAAGAAADTPSTKQSAIFATLFQPAEETGQGAVRCVKDPRFQQIFARAKLVTPISYHNVPGRPLGQVASRAGVFAKASTGFRAAIHGATSHAGEPHLGISPVAAVAAALSELTHLTKRSSDQEHDWQAAGALATITHACIGEATFGISPGDAVIHITLRAERWSTVAGLIAKATRIIEDAARAADPRLTTTFSTHDSFTETANGAATVEVLRQVAIARGHEYVDMPLPNSWSEDFGAIISYFGSHGAMIAMGAGVDCPALHTIGYDFPDALLQPAALLFVEAAQRLAQTTTTTAA